ncbi:MAG TPA: glycerophosphodiester phosphodiesterase [Burkholderiaceae bacterium]|nr:glycerophosphodiester phosphodiesterase [Burkholderiaceae bacterium]
MSKWPYPRVLAHRGGGSLAPENTIAAIKVGIQHGFRGVEFDAMLAADEVPVLMHDPTLERTGRVEGMISELRAAQLEKVDVGSWHSARFAGETVPTLQRTLRFCRDHDVWPNIEIKPSPGFEAATGAAVARTTCAIYADLVQPGGAQSAQVQPRVPLLSSFAPDALVAAAEVAPDLPLGWLVDELPPDWRTTLKNLRCVSVHINHRYLTAEQARQIKGAGAWLFCYTVNVSQRARTLFGWGVDALCTDAIDQVHADLAN